MFGLVVAKPSLFEVSYAGGYFSVDAGRATSFDFYVSICDHAVTTSKLGGWIWEGID